MDFANEFPHLRHRRRKQAIKRRWRRPKRHGPDVGRGGECRIEGLVPVGVAACPMPRHPIQTFTIPGPPRPPFRRSRLRPSGMSPRRPTFIARIRTGIRTGFRPHPLLKPQGPAYICPVPLGTMGINALVISGSDPGAVPGGSTKHPSLGGHGAETGSTNV